jgi:O-antigen/teichoic acid export membrane protein
MNMKTFWLILTGIFGIFGILNMARVIERLLIGEEWVPFQSLIAVLALLFAFISFGRARAASSQK